GEASTHPTIRTGRLEDSPMDDFRVRSWVVAPSLNSITCGGRTVRLEPKVMVSFCASPSTPGSVNASLFRLPLPRLRCLLPSHRRVQETPRPDPGLSRFRVPPGSVPRRRRPFVHRSPRVRWRGLRPVASRNLERRALPRRALCACCLPAADRERTY